LAMLIASAQAGRWLYR
ncbi:TPA: DUF1493 family protein, partial [Klebsiella aerogenes]|nr:DUF1493 family protein [Klebsiella aerogenes]